METRTIDWHHDRRVIPLRLDRAGEGPAVLCLPALSSISSRSEMHPLMRHLKSGFHVTTIDWPGFGVLPRPRLDWSPDRLSEFLSWVLAEIVPSPLGIVSAGHAAAYVVHEARTNRSLANRLVFIAPTWRGPFPTMLGGQRPWFASVRRAVDMPVIGPLLYRINLSGPVIGKMAQGHVYSDPSFLTPERMRPKKFVSNAEGARHASVRFVTGGLDRFNNRDAFLEAVARVEQPIQLIYGEETPPKSQAEMDALSRQEGVETLRLKRGKLAIHEEFAERLAPSFCRPDGPAGIAVQRSMPQC
jgi:hypothetical protein